MTEISCSARVPSPFPTMFKKFSSGQKKEKTVSSQETITEEEKEDRIES